MFGDIIALVKAQVTAAARRAVGPAAFAVIAALLVLFAVAGLFSALFFWLEPEHGPIAASLICAAVALVLAVVAAVPLMVKRKPPPPPPDAMLPQFVTLMTKSTDGLAPRQLIVTAAVVGAVLFLSARGGARR